MNILTCKTDSIESVQTVLKQSGQHWNSPDSIETVQTVLKLSRQYWNRLDSIETVRTVLKPSRQYWNRPDSIETVRTVLGPSGQYWNRPDSIQTVLTVSKLSKQYLNCSEANSLKPSILPGHGLHCAEKCGPFRLPLHCNRAKTFRTRKNFPVSDADALTGFLALWLIHLRLQYHDFNENLIWVYPSSSIWIFANSAKLG